jgi:acyl-CoA synthetase (AMP-forming)/AMP-acid ligase II
MPLSGPKLNQPVDPCTLLERGMQARGRDPALVSADGSWSWRDLDAVSTRLAGNLLGLGLQPGDRVASLMPNRDALVIHYLACLKAGLVTTPLNYRYTAREIDHALEVGKVAVLVSHAERDADIAASKLAKSLPLGVITYGARDGSGRRLEALMEDPSPGRPLPPPDPAAPAAVFFTSGSTGPAKGVTHSFTSLGWIIASKGAGLECRPQDVVMPCSSLSHEGGFGFALGALSTGSRVVVPRSLDAGEVLPLLRAHRPTVLWMLPAALIALVREGHAARGDFASLRLCVSGGDKVSPELEKEFTELTGFPIDELYGMTEIGCASVNPPSGKNKLGSVGRLCPGFSLSIRDENGQELATGREGRLWISSPTMMIGYWGDAAATAATVKDGWLDTGDVMKVDADGYIWFRGRKKQIIVHDGSNISPQEVEEALIEHPAVAAVGVVGVHDLVHGENVCAFVTVRDGMARPGSQELIRFARERVGYKAPEIIVLLDEMPLNPSGKVDRSALKRMAEARAS